MTDGVADAAGHGGAVDCYHGQAVAGSGGDCHLGDRVVHAGRVRDDRAGKHRAQRARTDHQAAKVGVAGRIQYGQDHEILSLWIWNDAYEGNSDNGSFGHIGCHKCYSELFIITRKTEVYDVSAR